MDTKEGKDFWISYNSADEGWATWMAWVLEQAGYSVVLQAWDFRPGGNFVLEMQAAAKSSKRTIAVLSPAYLGANFPQPEWAAAFAKDPQGKNGTLVPVVVEECEAEGLLGQVIHINLVGLDQSKAQQKLLAGLQPGRAKPLSPPVFPGSPNPKKRPTVKASATSAWAALGAPLPVVWRGDLPDVRKEGGATALELHLVPATPQHLEVRKLAELENELGQLGRGGGLFTNAESLKTYSDSELVYCQSNETPHTAGSGMLVTRSGQRGVWFTLPKDDMGSVLDYDDVQPRVESLIQLLLDVPISIAGQYGAALRAFPCVMLTIGSASIIGVRRSATMAFAMGGSESFEVPADDVMDMTGFSNQPQDIAAELIARLRSKIKS